MLLAPSRFASCCGATGEGGATKDEEDAASEFEGVAEAAGVTTGDGGCGVAEGEAGGGVTRGWTAGIEVLVAG